jgi:hypothetical protein
VNDSSSSPGLGSAAARREGSTSFPCTLRYLRWAAAPRRP